MSIDTKFANMPSGVANRWLDWANSHDWGGEPAKFLDTGAMCVESVEFSRDNVKSVVPFVAHTPRELRNWAGY